MFAPKPSAVRVNALATFRPSLWYYANGFLVGGVPDRRPAGQTVLSQIPANQFLGFAVLSLGVLTWARNDDCRAHQISWSLTPADRLIEKRGLIASRRREMELADIRSVEVDKRVFQRISSVSATSRSRPGPRAPITRSVFTESRIPTICRRNTRFTGGASSGWRNYPIRQATRPARYERRLWKLGIDAVAGVDEAGVGPMAGPVVAAAVVFAPETFISGVHDSETVESRAARRTLHPDQRGRNRDQGVGIAEGQRKSRSPQQYIGRRCRRGAAAQPRRTESHPRPRTG